MAAPHGTLPPHTATLIRVLSHLAVLTSAIGAAYSRYTHSTPACLLFTINLLSIAAVKHLYSRHLCKTCPVDTCPFNPRRRSRRQP